jgi:hypothetical protein
MSIQVPEDRPARMLAKRVVEGTTDSQQLAHTAAEARRAEQEGFTEIEWAEVEERPPYLVMGDGSLWRREVGIPKDGRRPRDWRYGITNPDNGVPVVLWFHRSLAPAPETVAELDQRGERKRKAAERQLAEVKRKREALRKSPPARTLTLGDADRVLGRATLRELARRLEAAGGVLMVERDGGLTVRVAVVNENVLRLGQALTAASATILSLAKRKPGPIDPESLPDAELTLGGDLLPPSLLGHGEVERR